MLRGDLAITRLDEVLRLLADDRATGRLALDEGDGTQGRTAEIYVATGEIYAAWLAERDADPVLAADARLRLRLLAEGKLREDAWDDAVGAQEELFDWSIGELLVELGHLDRASLERVATEELFDAVCRASSWTFGSYRFRRREKTRNRAGRTYSVAEFLDAVADRRAQRERLGLTADTVPSLGEAAPEAAGLEAAILGLVDGVRSVAEIEVGCGCTELEVAGILRTLADRGHVTLPAPAVEEAPEINEPPAVDPDDPVSRWSALLDATLPPAAHEEEPRATVELVRSDLPPRPVENLDPETAQRRARLRARAAEELLAAQAEAEALREAELARAALSGELTVIESLSVIEKTDERESFDASEQADEFEVVEPAEAPAEPIEVAETAAELMADPVFEETLGPVAEPAVEPVAEPPVEPVAEPAVEPVAEAAVEPSSNAEPEPSPEAILDLVAEELLQVELPLAEVPTEPASAGPTDGAEQPEPSESAEAQETEGVVDPLQPEAAQEQAPAAETEQLSADGSEHVGEFAREQVAGAVDGSEPPATDEPTDEPTDEHDPALAAALLRELSNLGLEDEPELTPARRSPRVPAPRHAAPASRKKRGIFGR